MVHDRRVDEDEQLFAPRRAVSFHDLKGLFGQALGQLAWIGNRRRRAQKDGIGPVMTANPPQPAKHVAEMTAEDPPVRVQLVDDHVAEVLEQLRPPRMVRQDARMHHVRIAQNQMRARANRPPGVLRRVAIVGEDANLRTSPAPAETRPRVRDGFGHCVQFGELILRERLGWKQIQGAARGILQDRIQHGRVVAERLARRRRRDHHHVTAGERVLDRLGLVSVELRKSHAPAARSTTAHRAPPGRARTAPAPREAAGPP